jgi:formylglycine-generating enzyme
MTFAEVMNQLTRFSRWQRPRAWRAMFRAVMSLGVLFLAGAAMGEIRVSLEVQTSPLVTVTGPAGTPVEVQWSDTLSDPGRWFYLAAQTLGASGPVADTNLPVATARFYRAVEVPDTSMVLIPGGSFMLGDTLGDGFTSELPVHSVSVSAVYLDRYEVTRHLWDDVYLWAGTNGYAFDQPGSAKAANHPVESINWYDAVKWCNARSEMEGRAPVYFTDGARTNVYRSGQINLTNGCVQWDAQGYRLPTEAEWEKAARGGESGRRFPWGNTISHSNANYTGTTYLNYDTSGTNGFDPVFATGALPFTSPVGWFPANAYGLYDMAGNVWEWCWDGYDPTWYGNVAAGVQDPRGPAGSVTNRVQRGGSWNDDASYVRCSSRVYQFSETFTAPDNWDDTLGFRCAMSVPVPLPPAILTAPARLPNGSFRFTIANLTPGKTNIVAVSTNLVTWTPVWTNVPTASSVNYTNAPAPGYFQLFRTWQLP